MAAAASPKTRRLNKKLKRGYTDLEVYAHLHPVKKDYLQENLDVYSLPERCNLGLVNIVDKPSAEAAEHLISE